MFAILAAITFALGAFGVRWDEVDILYVGLFFLTLSLLLDGHLWGIVRRPVSS